MNWGYKLMIAFILFAGMMIYLVYRSFQTNFELVEKTYYKSELAYQNIIDGTKLANQLSSRPDLRQSGDSIVLQMPKEMEGKELSGSIWFYCAYDSKKDLKIAIATSKDRIHAYKNLLTRGKYKAKISWTENNQAYYAEKDISIQ